MPRARWFIPTRCVLSFLTFAAFHTASTQSPDPLADPRSIITVGQARFTVLTPQLIRMEWSENGRFEDNASLVFINRKLPVPEFSVRKSDTALVLQTSFLTLRYTPGTGQFANDNLGIRLKVDGKEIVQAILAK